MNLWKKITTLFRKEKLDAEMAEEMRVHLERRVEANLADGMAPDEARYAARRQFGGVEQLKEIAREQRGWGWLAEFSRDLRLAFRSLGKSPGYALVAVVIVAIGIGAATAMFSTVNALMLRPVSLPKPERLAVVYETNLARNLTQFSSSIPNFTDWRNRSQSWESLAATDVRAMNLTGRGEPELLVANRVTASFFPTLGLPLVLGRGFHDAEDRPGSSDVAVVTSGFWQRQLGGKTDALGQTLTLDNRPYTIVGVIAANSPLPADDVEVLVPLAADVARENRMDHSILVYGRLKRGVTLEQADAEMKALAVQILRDEPEENRGWSTTLVPLERDIVGGEIRRGLYVLLGAVALLLVIACANLSNLMLVRATARTHELAVRTALGASRWRVARQLLTESVAVTAAGGVAGIALALWTIDALRALPLPRAAEISLDWRVLATGCMATLLTGVIAGIGAAWYASRARPQEALKSNSPRAGRRSRLRSAMVVAQIALSLTLLVGAALLTRSFWRLLHVNPGFNPEHVFTLSLRPTENAPQYYDDVARDVSALPGVTHAGTISRLPLTSGSTQNNIYAVAPTAIPAGQTVQANWRLISGDYFGAMQIPLLRGQDFRGLNPAEARRSMVVSASLARAFWGDTDPIGRQISRNGAVFTVVGVAGDVRSQQLGVEPSPTFYMSVRRFTDGPQSLVVRATGDPAAVIPALRTTIRKLNPGVPIFRISTMAEMRRASLQQERLLIALLGGFAGVALLLAALGTYGVVAFSVQQRTNEIGLRVAIGAQSRDILGLVLAQGARLVGLGLAFGLVGAFAASRVLSALLFETPPTDALSYLFATFALAAAALLAALIPARYALRVDPMVALRAE